MYSLSEYPLVSSPGALDAVNAIADRFEELSQAADAVQPADPLQWPGYGERLRRAAGASELAEAAVVGAIQVGDLPAIGISLDFRFMGGSMGAATGERIVTAIDEARRRRWPIVSLIASGGARVQEGMRALVQMQRIAAACEAARASGVPHIAVLRNPTTGGVWAALGSNADLVLALEDATVSFAGPRVRGDRGEAAEAFTSAGQFRHGAVDRVIDPREARREVTLALELLSPAVRGTPARAELPRARSCPGAAAPAERSGWGQVLAARSAGRPRALEYLDDYFDVRLEVGGDRAGGRDPGVLCGFGRRGGRTIAYAAQAGTPTTGAGFRTATRVLRQAAALRLPVLTLIDTPGAANDADAEAGCVGTAIGELMQTVASSPVPITSLVIGEGGSGGALALASPDDLWVTPDGYFAVIAPESAQAILRDETLTTEEVADRMRLTPPELVRLGIVRGIAGEHPA